jgi:hypothetical protein
MDRAIVDDENETWTDIGIGQESKTGNFETDFPYTILGIE